MATSTEAQHRRLLRQLAEAYYIDRRSKVQIAEEFALSRFQVARLLEESIGAGVVTITVESEAPASDDRARRLEESLGLDRVIVVDEPSSPTVAAMGRASLGFVAEHTRPRQRIGMSWSRTLDAAPSVPTLPRCTVVQLAGALQPWGHTADQGVFTRLGQDPTVQMTRLYAPLLVGAAGTAADLQALPEISEALRAADDLDLAVVSVGAWKREHSSVWTKCTAAQRDAARRDGAVAEVSGRLLALDGSAVHTIDERVIAVSLDQLRQAGTTVGVSYGPERADALMAAAAAGVLDVAVVDVGLARALLDRPEVAG